MKVTVFEEKVLELDKKVIDRRIFKKPIIRDVRFSIFDETNEISEKFKTETYIMCDYKNFEGTTKYYAFTQEQIDFFKKLFRNGDVNI